MPKNIIEEEILLEIYKMMEEENIQTPEEAQEFIKNLFLGNAALENESESMKLLEQAYKSPISKGKKLAKKALKLDPNNVEAYNYLGNIEEDIDKAIKLYKKGIKAAEKNFGKEFIKENEGYFWGILETRPYMIALENLASCYVSKGEIDKAIKIYKKMLKLNPNDNQGIRYNLFSLYLKKRDFKGIEKLMKKYPENISALWLYNVVLYYYLKEGITKNTIKALEKAYKYNPHVVDFLLGLKELPDEIPEYYTIGGEDEAVIYLTYNIDIWKENPDIIKLLFDFKQEKIKIN